MPGWMQAIGAGGVISAMVEGNERFKRRLPELEGKLFLFCPTDTNKSFCMTIRNGEATIILHPEREVDVTMKGEIRVLAGLLLGRVDPDTVFFTRKLEITGDTAAAILLKNILADL